MSALGVVSPLERLEELVSPLGLVGRVSRLPNAPGEPQYPIYTAELGNTAMVHSNVRMSTGGRSTRGDFDGAGGALDAEHASRVCIAEALERYASCTFSDEQLIWATARELGDDALALDQLPRHSEAELAHPDCPVLPIDLDAPMRWVQGVSLMTHRRLWVPAVLTYLHIPAFAIGERFALPISTGCAAHATLAAALVNALCEVVERDAIALTWLQRLALPRIELDEVPAALAPFVERDAGTSVQRLFFDATTDIGIPTVYSLDLSPENERLGQLVMCATTLDPVEALGKVSRESASSRIAMAAGREVPASPDEFVSVYHGAGHMGHRERRDRFDFLADSPGRRRLSEMPSLATGTPEGDLALVLGRLERAGMDAVAVELTTDEALDVGFRVVRTIVSGLMPLSFARRAQFRAHPRLYDAPLRMGLRAHAESALNDDPQPFA